jgi:recombination protein RecA
VGQEVVGNRTRVRVVKNKVAPPFRVAEFDIMYNEGISKVGDVLDLGVEAGLIEKRGAFYSYAEQRIGQGRENAKEALRASPELAWEIELAIRQATELVVPLDASDPDGEPAYDQEEVDQEAVAVEA